MRRHLNVVIARATKRSAPRTAHRAPRMAHGCRVTPARSRSKDRRMRALAIWLVSICTIASAAQVPSPRDAAPVPSGTATITGRVVVAGGNDPVPVRRARVVAEINGGQLTTDTDINGAYRIANAPAGTYRIRVEKPGFVMLGGAMGEVIMGTPLVIDGRRVAEHHDSRRCVRRRDRQRSGRAGRQCRRLGGAIALRTIGRVPVAVKSTALTIAGIDHTPRPGLLHQAGRIRSTRVAPTALRGAVSRRRGLRSAEDDGHRRRRHHRSRFQADAGADSPRHRRSRLSGKPVTTMALRIQRVGGRAAGAPSTSASRTVFRPAPSRRVTAGLGRGNARDAGSFQP